MVTGSSFENVIVDMLVSQEECQSELAALQHGTSYLTIGQSVLTVSQVGTPLSTLLFALPYLMPHRLPFFLLQFSSGQVVKFSPTIVFLHPGQFSVECRCSVDGQPLHNIGSRLHLTII